MNDKEEQCSVTDLVDPQLPHNNVVHRGGHLPPHVVVPTGVELQVNGTWGGDGAKVLCLFVSNFFFNNFFAATRQLRHESNLLLFFYCMAPYGRREVRGQSVERSHWLPWLYLPLCNLSFIRVNRAPPSQCTRELPLNPYFMYVSKGS